MEAQTDWHWKGTSSESMSWDRAVVERARRRERVREGKCILVVLGWELRVYLCV